MCINMLNIRGTVNKDIDNYPFYRYQMHKPHIKTERNNKVFSNINVIAKEIARDPKDLIKYIKSKNGINIVEKADRVVIPYKLEDRIILESIYSFIQDHVLCKKCKLPETHIVEKKMICKCCSFRE